MATDTAHKEAHDTHSDEADWSGGVPVFKASYGKLMMWYFLLSDAFTFAGFLIAYGTLRFSSETWPVPDFVFQTAPFNNLGLGHGTGLPLIFVTFMSFLLIISSVTMVRAVQEGHRENKNAVVFWMFLTIIGGAGFLGCQAWEWTNLIGTEHMSLTTNPFGTYTEGGTYMNADGSVSGSETFKAGESYLIHMTHVGGDAHDDHGDHELTGEQKFLHDANAMIESQVSKGGVSMANLPGEGINFKGFILDGDGFIHRKYKTNGGELGFQEFGPKAFGALFFFITGFTKHEHKPVANAKGKSCTQLIHIFTEEPT